jgi:hypothetical protein
VPQQPSAAAGGMGCAERNDVHCLMILRKTGRKSRFVHSVHFSWFLLNSTGYNGYGTSCQRQGFLLLNPSS